MSDLSYCSFAMAMREIKYQMLQRRRGMHDTVYAILTKLDDKQTLLEHFRNEFNSFDLDFRFDPECQAELHLRTLELRDSYWLLCEKRKIAAEEHINKLACDALTNVMQIRTQCEGAAMMQSELNRYLAAVQIIFDYTKAVCGYTSNDQLRENELEDVIGGDESKSKLVSKNTSKDLMKDKKGKGNTSTSNGNYVPFRIPIPTVLFNSNIISELPEPTNPNVEIDNTQIKNGKPPKGNDKKSTDTIKDSPIETAEKMAIESSNIYSKGIFIVNRDLYCNDEALCIIIENAIWYETKKFRQSITNIKKLVNEQVVLLQLLELDIQQRMKKIIHQTQLQELAVCERIITLIQDHITICEPITQEWLIAPDAISITPSHVVYQPPIKDPSLC